MTAKTEARWQYKVSSLKQGIAKIYENKELADAEFIVQGKTYRVHKLILASRSHEFARILLDSNVPDEHIVDKDYITPNGFEILLRFIYTDEIGTDNKKSIIEASIAAEHYRQRALLDECQKKIESWTITKDEVWGLLDSGRMIPYLRDKCLEYIRSNPSDIISSNAFLDISFECLNVIIDNGALNDVDLSVRINRIMEWGALRHDNNYALVREEFLKDKPPFLGKLGFERLSLLEFGTAVGKFQKLFLPDEVVMFMIYLNSNAPNPLPAWCSPST